MVAATEDKSSNRLADVFKMALLHSFIFCILFITGQPGGFCHQRALPLARL